ncbi:MULTISPECIES: hypothetical protein [Pelosinus]|uniref:Uncharacterized protein n=1 Tax=Pelosinus fermentans B4 TaxID=1149862 RepID=I8R9W0_9FIRM|nr:MULTISPECIES: hypothetical protein [Pelosinus]EIW15608.1 hypothetical protein FB4_1297 [Pelosinus fermentans B4]EIW26702.1 hypothetical protein FA11_1706 [Pelosinus fermentans A11]OAM92353.1 hypothetical protein FR7_00369 [Pelosinus fermentans DSM 17108]SDQ41866.1 hypothetical protein SAMN04515679_0414 [Pelosinus fermentans]
MDRIPKHHIFIPEMAENTNDFSTNIMAVQFVERFDIQYQTHYNNDNQYHYYNATYIYNKVDMLFYRL